MYSLQKLLQLIHTQPFVRQSWADVWDFAASVWSLQMVGPLWNPQASDGGVSSPPTYFCHSSSLRDTEGWSIHLCASPDETVYPEKKIARATDTEDQRKEWGTVYGRIHLAKR